MTDFLWGRYQPFVVAYVNKKLGPQSFIGRDLTRKPGHTYIYIYYDLLASELLNRLNLQLTLQIRDHAVW